MTEKEQSKLKNYVLWLLSRQEYSKTQIQQKLKAVFEKIQDPKGKKVKTNASTLGTRGHHFSLVTLPFYSQAIKTQLLLHFSSYCFILPVDYHYPL